MLDVRRLQVLCEVARRGSLSRAAEALTYTPSAVSQQIAALEREVGMALIERRPRGVVLTDAGALLVEHAHVVLDQLAAAESALADLVALRRGQLRLASFATAGATVVPRAVDAFQARYPDVSLRVRQATSTEGVALVRAGAIDLALTVDQLPMPGVDIVDLFADPYRVALHRTHRLAALPEIALRDLAGDRWIDVPRHAPGGEVLAGAFARLEVSYSVAYESDEYTTLHELVGAGLGVALLPDLALLPANDDVVLRGIGPEKLHRRIQAALRPEPVRSPAAAAMLAILRDLAARRANAIAQPAPSR